MLTPVPHAAAGRPVSCALIALLCALTPVGTAWAQSGTLQLPAHRSAETAPPAPKAAPLTPVHRAEPHHAVRHPPPHHPEPHHVPPVVAPHPAEHGHPPPARKAEAKPAKPVEPAPARPAEPDKGTTTGLPLPRFASLRTDEVNLRAGPGTRYPIEWVYKRRNMPVEIEREFDVWRLVKDSDGIRGWVHQATLTGRRSFEVEHHDATLRADPRDSAAAVAVLKPGVIGRIRSCSAGSAWCRVQVGRYGGYLPRSAFWGALPGEVIAR